MDQSSPATTEPTVEAQPAQALLDVDLPTAIEAALISSDKPLSAAKLAEIIPGSHAKGIAQAVDELNSFYDQTRRSFRIESLAGGWQIMTRSSFAAIVSLLHKSRQQTKLTPALLETLAIVAYKQPVLRAEVESIRGVASGEALRSLMERRLVKIVGRAEEVGRPMLYGTTKTFLEVFGLSSVKDLPSPPLSPLTPSTSSATKTNSPESPSPGLFDGTATEPSNSPTA